MRTAPLNLAFPGGVSVAAGDVTGDGAPTSGRAAAGRTYEPSAWWAVDGSRQLLAYDLRSRGVERGGREM